MAFGFGGQVGDDLVDHVRFYVFLGVFEARRFAAGVGFFLFQHWLLLLLYLDCVFGTKRGDFCFWRGKSAAGRESVGERVVGVRESGNAEWLDPLIVAGCVHSKLL